MPDDNIPTYTPMPSLGHELGIMFGFIIACFLIVGVYSVVWRAVQRRNAARDLVRRKDLHTRGILREEGREEGRAKGKEERVHEKMLDRYAMPVDRVELPVHQVDDVRMGR